MFGIFGRKPKDGPPNSVGEAKKLMERLGPARGGEIIRTAAISVNISRSRFIFSFPPSARMQSGVF